jgi:hypothetical protein
MAAWCHRRPVRTSRPNCARRERSGCLEARAVGKAVTGHERRDRIAVVRAVRERLLDRLHLGCVLGVRGRDQLGEQRLFRGEVALLGSDPLRRELVLVRALRHESLDLLQVRREQHDQLLRVLGDRGVVGLRRRGRHAFHLRQRARAHRVRLRHELSLRQRAGRIARRGRRRGQGCATGGGRRGLPRARGRGGAPRDRDRSRGQQRTRNPATCSVCRVARQVPLPMPMLVKFHSQCLCQTNALNRSNPAANFVTGNRFPDARIGTVIWSALYGPTPSRSGSP